MSDFIRVARVSDIPDPGKITLEVSDRLLVLIKANGLFYCLDDVCTHDGGPLGEGTLSDGAIACPRHGAKFDVHTGKALTMPATEDTGSHEVKVIGEEVFLRIGG